MFAITGVTGQVGGATARFLLDAGASVRAVVRDRAKGEIWRAKGCDVAVADMADAKALARAFTDVEGVFILIPPLFDPSPGFPEVKAVIAALTAAIQQANPPRIVCLSTVGAQVERPNLLRQLGLVEAALGELKTPTTFLRAAWFMENFSGDVVAARETGTIHSYLQPVDRAIPMVAAIDIGRLAANLLREDWRGRRVVELMGTHPVSPNDIAACFTRLLGRPVKAVPVERQRWEALFRSQGAQNPTPRAQMIDGFNEGWIAFEGSPRKGETDFEAVLRELVARG